MEPASTFDRQRLSVSFPVRASIYDRLEQVIWTGNMFKLKSSGCLLLVFAASCSVCLSVRASDEESKTVPSSASTFDQSKTPSDNPQNGQCPSSEAAVTPVPLSAPEAGGTGSGQQVIGAQQGYVLQEEKVPCFQLRTIQNEIWSPVSSQSILRGQVAQTEPAPSGTVLHGGVSYMVRPGSVLSTIQRKVAAQFLTNFSSLEPQYDFSMFANLKAQLARAKPMLDAAIKRAKAEMDAQLAQQPLLQGNLESPRLPQLNRLVPAFDARLATPPPQLQSEINRAKKEMEAQLSRPKPTFSSSDLSRALTNPSREWEIQQQLQGQLLRSKSMRDKEIEIASRQMRSELNRRSSPVAGNAVGNVDGRLVSEQLKSALGNRMPAELPDLTAAINSQIAAARKATDAKIAAARPELEAVYTRLRQVPDLKTRGELLPRPQLEAKGEMERLIPWDRWYAGVASAYEPLLLSALHKYHDPAGSNTVSISVWPDRHLVVSLAKKSNPKFDAATLEAYRALDGDASLQYPPGSQRQKVTFLIDNTHKSSREIADVNSQTCRGDNEVQVLKNR